VCNHASSAATSGALSPLYKSISGALTADAAFNGKRATKVQRLIVSDGLEQPMRVHAKDTTVPALGNAQDRI
jgi:hypothetical protein